MNSPRSAGLIIILDTGPQMAPHWPVIRNGIAQMMLVLTKDTLIAGKYNLRALMLFQLPSISTYMRVLLQIKRLDHVQVNCELDGCRYFDFCPFIVFVF